jgi:hypothetical protein
MHYYIFRPSRPHVLKALPSHDALEELLSHDYRHGKDWAAEDVVIDDRGRKGAIAYDGTEYECRFGEETAPPEELRRILTAHLPAIGWSRKKIAPAVAGVDSLERFESVVRMHPPREGGARWIVAAVLLLATIALVVGLTWAFFHFSGVKPPWEKEPPDATQPARRGGGGG